MSRDPDLIPCSRPRFPKAETGSIGGMDRTQHPGLRHIAIGSMFLMFDDRLEFLDGLPELLSECAAMMHALNPSEAKP